MFVRFQARAICFLAAFLLVQSAAAQDTGVIDKLLEFAREKKKAEPKAGDDELRKLLIQRYNVALDELTQQCEDFKKNLTAQQAVFDAARHLVQADLEMQTEPKDRAKVLENALEIVKWYEAKLEAGLKANIGSRAELLRTQYIRLTFEIDLAKIRKEMKSDK
jgi:hypothetical protein